MTATFLTLVRNFGRVYLEKERRERDGGEEETIIEGEILFDFSRYVSLRAARLLHNEMLARVLHAPMAFFDTTPVGMLLFILFFYFLSK